MSVSTFVFEDEKPGFRGECATKRSEEVLISRSYGKTCLFLPTPSEGRMEFMERRLTNIIMALLVASIALLGTGCGSSSESETTLEIPPEPPSKSFAITSGSAAVTYTETAPGDLNASFQTGNPLTVIGSITPGSAFGELLSMTVTDTQVTFAGQPALSSLSINIQSGVGTTFQQGGSFAAGTDNVIVSASVAQVGSNQIGIAYANESSSTGSVVVTALSESQIILTFTNFQLIPQATASSNPTTTPVTLNGTVTGNLVEN